MNVLLDTCVIAEMRRPRPNTQVQGALASLPDSSLFLSVLSVGEIAKGVALLPAGRKKQSLTNWLNGLETYFQDRILAVDVQTTRLWGELTARGQQKGISIPSVDGLLAATALRHGLHVMTRNTRHFRSTGAVVIDPWTR